ncbi:MAG: CFI-box-CTERM domain-containing protein [Bdellovibrionota bacterium]
MGGTSAQATLALTSVSGISKPVSGSASPYTIYAGMAYFNGESASSYGCSTGTCNTCQSIAATAAFPFVPCNETSVMPTTNFVVNLTLSGTTLPTAVRLCEGSNGISTGVISGSTATITVPWSSMCSFVLGAACTTVQRGSKTLKIVESSDCSATSALDLNVVMSVNITAGDDYVADCSSVAAVDEGVCFFSAQEGDEKIYITDFKIPTNYPAIADVVKFEGLTLFSETAASAAAGRAALKSSSRRDSLTITGGSLESQFVSGLTNDSLYCITVGNRDNTGNIYQFIDVSSLVLYPDDNICLRPSEVVGILSDKKCFIATAAYGSDMDQHVETLRVFRNEFMAHSALGRAMVKAYYRLSPPLADFISHNEVLKTATRLVLWPLVWLAELSVKFGANLLLIIFAGLFSIAGIFILRRKKYKFLPFFLVATLLSFNGKKAEAQEIQMNRAGTATTNTEIPIEDEFNLESESGDVPVTAAPPENSTVITDVPVTEQPAEPVQTTARRKKNVANGPNVVPRKKPGPREIYDKDGLKKEGLYKVDKHGAFFYRVQKATKSDQTLNVRIGQITAPEITAESKDGVVYEFSDIYPNNSIMMLNVDYEWQPFLKYGKLGLVGGVGFFTVQGNGRFSDSSNTKVPIEKYTFYALPFSLGAVYKLDFLRRQWFVPYASGGGTYYILIERRDDNKTTYLGTPAVYAAAGGMFNITALDREFSYKMDNQYGIANVWLSVEYRRIQSANSELDMTTNFISAGLGMDY